jgi:hypothetical protein
MSQIGSISLAARNGRKFWWRFAHFWVRNVLLTANLSANPANLWVNGVFFCLTYRFLVVRLGSPAIRLETRGAESLRHCCMSAQSSPA